ncbi:hypothetical protein A2Z22_02140 [Candidatus Woesebacteria bacterium RBG_16_34_12]|uniref:Peptidase S9 prolyl oligopeptidase catalytic domain-containing protein n=1 Tax=Candidatus Woesebacteria bacterium RBG_16_34_12 TaxID=1802480 RepID=A0A1F7XB60_9BACT|nr:MAG: hypothetical protein A2Z22_02140 [Candidatus Woesebacteria bacterium RBG_16_34_12]
MNSNSTLLKLGKISGIYYPCGYKTKTILIYGIGTPNVPDNGNLPEAKTVSEAGYDIFVPDYIGFGRSPGTFTPTNCIKTFLILYELFKKGIKGINNYTHKNIFLKYQKILFAGRSLAGAYLPLLPRYNKDIKYLGIIFGALDQSEQGIIKGEETNRDFINSIMLDGYKYLYKGFNKKIWLKHLNDLDGLSPMDNIKYLKNSVIFIAHGKKDTCIHYSKSVKFYNILIKTFPDNKNQYKLKLYENGSHNSLTATKALEDYLKFIRGGDY